MKPISQYDDKQLFHLVSKGSEEAFTELFHRFTPRLLPFINKLTRNENLTRELIQETFLRLWLKRAELREVEYPPSWIYGIASHVSLTFLKTQANRKRLLEKMVLNTTSESLSDVMDSKELGLIIRKAVALLPERRQEIYRLSREQGLTHQQIAQKLDLSQNTVKNQIGISLKFIQEFINRNTGLSLLTLPILLSY